MKNLLVVLLAIFIIVAPLSSVYAYYSSCDRAAASGWHDRGSVTACIMEIIAAITYGGDTHFPGDGDDLGG